MHGTYKECLLIKLANNGFKERNLLSVADIKIKIFSCVLPCFII